MHLIQRYSLSSGSKIDRPSIREKYYPLPFESYITLHTTSKDAKTYSFWNDVLDILTPVLQKEGIQVVQVGGKDDKPCRNAFRILGMTTVNQTAYIIKRGLLHLGVDSFPVHLASADEDHKIVALYSTNFASVVKPYWGKPENHILLEPDRGEKRPTFSERESPKSIDTIKPEVIARAVSKLLNLPLDWRFDTIFTGAYYHNNMVESTPNHVVDIANLGIDALIMRMDYQFNEQYLAQQLQRCKCSIVTDKPIDLNLISTFKSQIIELVYIIERHNHPKFIRELQRLGVAYHLLTYLPNHEMDKHKLNFMEFGILHKREINCPEIIEKNKGKNLFYKSAKYILSDQKVYPSRFAMLTNRPIPNLGPAICRLDVPEKFREDFLKEVENFSIMIDGK